MSVEDKKDRLFSQPGGDKFEFNEQVAGVFFDMVNRSVPGYSLMAATIPVMAVDSYQSGTVIYDLGASLGTVSANIGAVLPDARLIAVDNSPAMVAKCRERLAAFAGFEVLQADINNIEFEPASVVILNLTLQFLALEDRLPLLQRIQEALVPGGILILSEKTKWEDENQDRWRIQNHETFKKLQGYSELEISRKRSALEAVLIPETEEDHRLRLKAAGLSDVKKWFQCFNFCSWVAHKK